MVANPTPRPVREMTTSSRHSERITPTVHPTRTPKCLARLFLLFPARGVSGRCSRNYLAVVGHNYVGGVCLRLESQMVWPARQESQATTCLAKVIQERDHGSKGLGDVRCVRIRSVSPSAFNRQARPGETTPQGEGGAPDGDPSGRVPTRAFHMSRHVSMLHETCPATREYRLALTHPLSSGLRTAKGTM